MQPSGLPTIDSRILAYSVLCIIHACPASPLLVIAQQYSAVVHDIKQTAPLEQHNQRRAAAACESYAAMVHMMLCTTAGTLQLIQKKYLHYALMPGQPVPEWLKVMQQQPARHSIPAGAQQADLTLFSFTKQMAFAPKQVINSQVHCCAVL